MSQSVVFCYGSPNKLMGSLIYLFKKIFTANVHSTPDMLLVSGDEILNKGEHPGKHEMHVKC